jgi:prepilin-type N-terminal cleavage/methylation domain-containing protein
MWGADAPHMSRSEDGFTLLEMLTVMIVMAILLTIAVGFQIGARERAADASARANIRTAIPAMEAYRADTGTYAGMTLAVLQASYSPGVVGIAVVSATASTYCVSAGIDSATWFKAGPSAPITETACS